MKLHAVPVATILVLIFAVIGGLVVLIHPHTLSFPGYLNAMKWAVGLLAIGRGLDAVTKP